MIYFDILSLVNFKLCRTVERKAILSLSQWGKIICGGWVICLPKAFGWMSPTATKFNSWSSSCTQWKSKRTNKYKQQRDRKTINKKEIKNYKYRRKTYIRYVCCKREYRYLYQELRATKNCWEKDELAPQVGAPSLFSRRRRPCFWGRWASLCEPKSKDK